MAVLPEEILKKKFNSIHATYSIEIKIACNNSMVWSNRIYKWSDSSSQNRAEAEEEGSQQPNSEESSGDVQLRTSNTEVSHRKILPIAKNTQ